MSADGLKEPLNKIEQMHDEFVKKAKEIGLDLTPLTEEEEYRMNMCFKCETDPRFCDD